MSPTGPVPLWRRIFVERRAVLLPLAVALVANVLALGLGVLPQQQGVVSAEHAAVNARLTLANANVTDKAAKEIRIGKDRADQEMKKFYAEILPRNFQEAVSIMNFWLLKVSEETRVPFRSGSSTSKPSPEPSNLVKVMTKATLTGDYADIRRFLYELETAQQFVIIESMELTQSGTQQAGGVLEVAIEIATYYVADQAGEKSGKSGAQ